MAITTFQEKHALPLSFVSEGKKYWVLIEWVCITLDFLHQIHSVVFVPCVAILLVGDFPGSV